MIHKKVIAQIIWVIRNSKQNLGFGLDFDFEQVDLDGENIGEIPAGARVF